MKKFFGCFVLCLVMKNGAFHTLPYSAKIADGAPLHTIRSEFSSEEKLTFKLLHVLTHFCDDVFDEVKALLEQGANPNGFGVWYDSPLSWAVVRQEGRLVTLLLDFGANPMGVPVAEARNLEIIQLLVRGGKNINTKDLLGSTLLYNLVNDGDLPAVVWVLKHGGELPARLGRVPLYEASCNHHFEKIVALLRCGVRIDTLSKIFLTEGSCHLTWAPNVLALYEFLIARSHHELNPYCLYTLDEYEAMGISRESAELIEKATQEVNEAFAQCRLDDWSYDHPGQSLSKFILDREIGKFGKHRK